MLLFTWPTYERTLRCATVADVFEREFLIVADTEARNIYQLGLAESRIVRLLTPNLERRPVAVAFDDRRHIIFWTDVAATRIVSRRLMTPESVDDSRDVYIAGITVLCLHSAPVVIYVGM